MKDLRVVPGFPLAGGLAALTLTLTPLASPAAKPADQRADYWIGYTAGRTDLQGYFANQVTARAFVVKGDGSGLVSQYQSWGTTPENVFAVYNAVECADVNWPRNWAKWQADAERVYRAAPFETWDNVWFNAACAFWPVTGPAKPFAVNGAGLPPVLMLQGTLDPATPYAGAQVAHRLLPSARMVVVEGGGNHGQSMEIPPNQCVQSYLNAYLATGAVPERPGLVNATCPAPADPTPGW